jgi:type IV pilus assembly protein PilP
MKHLKLIVKSLPICLSITLLGCSSEGGDDLDTFIRTAGNDMPVKVKPLPEVKSYTSFDYNADGILSDPFRSRKVANKSGHLQPNMNRPRELLESYPLESLKYVGILAKSKMIYGLLKTPDNGVQQVKIGQYVGQNFGMVSEITDSEIVLKEIIQDETSGDWIERVAVIALQE